jgi:hypothetical protein
MATSFICRFAIPVTNPNKDCILTHHESLGNCDIKPFLWCGGLREVPSRESAVVSWTVDIADN